MNSRPRHTIDILFVLTLFCGFSFSVIMLTGTGATVYENVVDEMEESYTSRTSYSYIVNKVHQSDQNGALSVGSYHGKNALIISEEIDNIVYCTYLYAWDGMLKEMFSRKDQDLDPSFGNNIMPIDAFNVYRITDDLYRFDITPSESEPEVLFVHSRSTK